MKGKKIYIAILLAVLLFASCDTNEPSQKVGMSISICLPASEVHDAARAPRRVMGDPGTTEKYLFPLHLYFIVMKKTGLTTWELWTQEHRTLTKDDWVAKHYVGLLPTMEDSVYQYTQEINLLLSSTDKFVGHVYAIASAEELSFNQTLSSIGSMTDLLDLTFSTSTNAIQQNLQHIYSTPYNLEVNGEYYGSFNSTYQRVPHIDLLLYHVAAKVDINWYVPTNLRYDKETPSNGIRLTYMDACNLFNGNAYCFRPLENVVEDEPLDEGATKHIIGAGDEGLWWEGRSYFYTIPYTTDVAEYKNYYPLQMLMKTNGSEGEGCASTIYMQIDKTSPFVPWLRATFNISKTLTDGSTETKTVNLPSAP